MTTRTPKVIDTAPKVWDGQCCPVCGNTEVEGDNFDDDERGMRQVTDCHECGHTWNAIFVPVCAEVWAKEDDGSIGHVVPNADNALINAAVEVLRLLTDPQKEGSLFGAVPVLQDILEQYGVEI